MISCGSPNKSGDNSNNSAWIFRAEFQRRTESMNRFMMRILFAAILMAASVMTQAKAQTSTIAPAKIAFIDLEDVLFTCDEGKKVFGDIQRFVDKKSGEMDAMRKELDKLNNDLIMQKDIVKPEVLEEMKDAIENKELILQRFQQDTQKEINRKRDKATHDLMDKIEPIIEKVAKEKGANVIQAINASRDAYIDPSLKITKDIIDAVNKETAGGTLKTPPKKSSEK
jgi:Skp family chaperone for outer membrane proteins